jgi:DNA-binding CsgD family transcriptional regulator
MKLFISITFLFVFFSGISQVDGVSGKISLPKGWSNKVYLSVKTNYRTIDIIDRSDIIASTVADSLGNFAFDSKYLSSEERIYQIHVSPEPDEVEVFMSDHSKNGFGRNFAVFVTNGKHPVEFTPSKNGKLFGPIVAFKTASAWQQLETIYSEFASNSYRDERNKEDLFYSNYHDAIVYLIKDEHVLNKFIGCYYLLKEKANLSPAYLQSIDRHSKFLKTLEQASNKKSKHSQQLSKEVGLIRLQIDGLNETEELESTIEWLYILIIVMFSIMFILTIIIIRLLRIANSEIKLGLTQREEKIKQLIISGKSNKEIGAELFISVSTVKTHINTLYKKEGTPSRTALIQKYSNGD